MSMEPGTLFKTVAPETWVGIGSDGVLKVMQGSIGIVLGPYDDEDDDDADRHAVEVMISGQSGWLWEHEIEAADEAR